MVLKFILSARVRYTPSHNKRLLLLLKKIVNNHEEGSCGSHAVESEGVTRCTVDNLNVEYLSLPHLDGGGSND